jgi:hypothetical protein
MAKIESVRPGDLITAARYNELIAHVQQLEDRVAVLEGGATGTGQKPVILDTVPAEQVRAGEPLEIIGLNFTPGNDIITVGGFPIEAVDGRSSSTRLLFDVPMLAVTGGSRQIFVTVRNTFGVASKPLTLLPAIPKPVGNLSFGGDSTIPNPGTLSPGNSSPYVFALTVTSQTDIAETYQMSLVFDGITGSMSEQAWRNAIVLRDGSNNPIATDRQIRLEPYDAFKARLLLSVPASAVPNVDGVNVSVHVRSLSNGPGLTQTSSPFEIRVGARTETSDPGVEFSVDTLDGNAREAGDGSIEFPYKRPGQVAEDYRLDVLATFREAANSTEFFATVIPSNSIWTINYGPKGARPGRQIGDMQVVGSLLKLNQERPIGGTHPEQAQLKVSVVRTVGANTFTSFRIFNIRGY